MENEQVATQPVMPAMEQAPTPVRVPEDKRVSKFGKQKQVEIKRSNGGVDKYTLQYPGIRKAMEIIDNSTMANGQLARSIFAEQLLSEVVVEPAGLSLDDFDEREGINQLIDEADEFLSDMWK